MIQNFVTAPQTISDSTVESQDDRRPQEDIVVSLLFTESASHFLHLDLPHIEDLLHESDSEIRTIVDKSDDADEFNTYQLLPKYYKDLPVDVAYVPVDSLPTSSTSIIFEDVWGEGSKRNEPTREHVLKPVMVHMRLLTTHSLAHENKISSDTNGIYISELESEVHKRLLVTKSGWINVCRICHGGESNGNLVGACRCRGSVALTHVECLERWLKESTNSNCELCNFHFQIVREPKYSVPYSIILFLKNPDAHAPVLIVDAITFFVYTPTVVVSSYMLMILCDTIARTNVPNTKRITTHMMAFCAIFGMALIDFTYFSWLLTALQRHTSAWCEWYKRHCDLKLILPKRKLNLYSKRDERDRPSV